MKAPNMFIYFDEEIHESEFEEAMGSVAILLKYLGMTSIDGFHAIVCPRRNGAAGKLTRDDGTIGCIKFSRADPAEDDTLGLKWVPAIVALDETEFWSPTIERLMSDLGNSPA